MKELIHVKNTSIFCFEFRIENNFYLVEWEQQPGTAHQPLRFRIRTFQWQNNTEIVPPTPSRNVTDPLWQPLGKLEFEYMEGPSNARSEELLKQNLHS